MSANANQLSQEPYRSLDSLREANDELILSMPKDDSPSADSERSTAEAKRTEFIRRAIETGRVLDTPADRKVAQGLIDYWVVSGYAASDAESAEPPPLWGVKALLKPFDETSMRGIAKASDDAIHKLDHEDQAAARRILLRLVRFSDGTWISSPKIRGTLLSHVDAARVNEIIEVLRKKDALIVISTPEGECVKLGYEALLRQWETLNRWIDERARFRDAALFWLRKGKNKGALLSAALAKSAVEYGDLETVEWEFIEESKNYARRRRRTLILLAILIFLIPGVPLIVYLILDWYARVHIPAVATKMLIEARSPYTNADVRKQNMAWLAEYGQSFDFSQTVLRHFDLKALAIAQANFRQAILDDVDFSGATLASAHFDDAHLEKIKFLQANLNGSVFDQAELCNVDFSGADLTFASFLNISYAESAPPNFKDTAWWLSTGWNLRHVDLFRKQQGELDPILADNRKALSQKNGTYSRAIKRFEAMVKSSSQRGLDRAVALDGMSWYRAIWGLDLADAEKTAEQAVKIVQELNPKPDVLTESYVTDTLAYILLQMDRPQDARKWSEIANRARDFNPGATFRHALALHILADASEAERNLKLALQRGYWPSSELLLLRRYFSDLDVFGTTLANLSEKRQIVPGSVCWLNQN